MLRRRHTGEHSRDVIESLTGAIRAVLDPDHGGEILSLGTPGGPNVLFEAPWKPQASPGDWLGRYRGGWQVMFPNAGGASEVDGMVHPLHGEASVEPAEVRARTNGSVMLCWDVPLGLRLERTISLDAERPVVRVEDVVTNPSGRSLRYALGQHPAFAARPGMRLDLPPGRLEVEAGFEWPEIDLRPGTSGEWPHAPRKDGSTARVDVVADPVVERILYLPDRPAGWGALRDPATGTGVALAWDAAAFPHVWMWEAMHPTRPPFLGHERLVTIEPVSCWPSGGLAETIARGQARTIESGERHAAWTTLALFGATDVPVTGVDRDGRVTLGEESL
jgi:galactose mutarotase-like enzyme